jgi:hypothetical protein
VNAIYAATGGNTYDKDGVRKAFLYNVWSGALAIVDYNNFPLASLGCGCNRFQSRLDGILGHCIRE